MKHSILLTVRSLLLSAFVIIAFSGCGLLGAALQLPGVLAKGVGKVLGVASGAAAGSSPVLLNASLEVESEEIGNFVPRRQDSGTPLR